jgi:hypothetical protein
MTQFQLVCAAVFVLAALVVYRSVLVNCVRNLLGKLPHRIAAPEVQPSIAVNLVHDIVSVTQLRDRLAAEGCQEGVDACTVLLRVIVEFKEPSKGVV